MDESEVAARLAEQLLGRGKPKAAAEGRSRKKKGTKKSVAITGDGNHVHYHAPCPPGTQARPLYRGRSPFGGVGKRSKALEEVIRLIQHHGWEQVESILLYLQAMHRGDQIQRTG